MSSSVTDMPDQPSPSMKALKQGLSRCRQAYPQAQWPATGNQQGWLWLAARWQSGCYGMDDEVFLRAVEDHIVGPYRQYTACPGHLWVAVDLRREAEGPAGVKPEPQRTVILDRQARIGEHMEEIRRQMGGKK